MAMYEIWIRYYKDANGVHDEEKLLYSIPFSPDNENVLIDPIVKTEMGRAGSFEFSLYDNHPYYNSWMQMKTMLRVVYAGETIFYGRVLTIDVDHLSGKKHIHCEGYLAFLMDSQVEGTAEADRKAESAYGYLTRLIENHNSQMAGSVPNKQFAIGMVPDHWESARSDQQVKTDIARQGSSSWQDTASAISSLTGQYGGYLRTRYVDGVVYLDWLDNYFNYDVGERVIEVANNVITLNSSVEVNNIFTVLIPVGKKTNEKANNDALYLNPRELWVKDIGDHYTEEQLQTTYQCLADYQSSLDQYGVIYKVVNFSNADSTSKLSEWAWDYIKTNYHGGLTSFTANAVDLIITGNSNKPLLSGDRVMTRYPNVHGGTYEKELTILSAEYPLHNPESDTFTIGIPNNLLKKEYGDKSNSTGGKSSDSGGGGGGPKWHPDDSDQLIDHFFGVHVVSASNNNPEYTDYKEKYGDEAAASILKSAEIHLSDAFDRLDEDDEPSKVAQRRIHNAVISGHKKGSIKLSDTSALERFPGLTQEAVDKIAEFQDAVTSIELDAMNSALTVKEKFDYIVDMAAQDAQEQIGAFSPKPLIKIGLERGADGKLQQAGTMYTWRSDKKSDSSSQTDSKMTSFIEGAKGAFGGSDISLSNIANDEVQKLKDEVAGFIPKVHASGLDSSLTVSPDNRKETVKVDGKGNSNKGTVDVGNKNGQWQVQMNQPIKYIVRNDDGSQTTVTVPDGTVDANDFAMLKNTQKVPSVSAKIASFDLVTTNTFIAMNTITNRLQAAEADIDDLEADYANIDVIISNHLTRANEIQANRVNTKSFALNGYYGSWATASLRGADGSTVTLNYLKRGT